MCSPAGASSLLSLNPPPSPLANILHAAPPTLANLWQWRRERIIIYQGTPGNNHVCATMGLLLSLLLLQEKGSVHRPWFSLSVRHSSRRPHQGEAMKFHFLVQTQSIRTNVQRAALLFLYSQGKSLFFTHTHTLSELPRWPTRFFANFYLSLASLICLAPDKSPGAVRAHEIISETVVNPFLDISLAFFTRAAAQGKYK